MLKLEDLFYISDYSTSENTSILTIHFIEQRTVIGPARPS